MNPFQGLTRAKRFFSQLKEKSLHLGQAQSHQVDFRFAHRHHRLSSILAENRH
jgi:hypothetical protein